MNLSMMFQIAKFVIWLVLNIKEFVLDAEARDPAPNRGAEKKSAVVKAVKVAASAAGMAQAAIEAVEKMGVIDGEIEDAVASEINPSKVTAR